MSISLNHKDATVHIEELPNNLRSVKVSMTDEGSFVPVSKCVTSYPISLIETILEVKGAAYLCDEMMREEDTSYLQRDLQSDLLAYFDKSDFDGKRLLDFGCGGGASTAILARMFPHTEIVGVELFGDLLTIARKRIEHYKLPNVRFLQSPSGEELPSGVGQFDVVILSAVYEHLLPQERETIMPKLWAVMRDDGFLFINLTPNRLFPVEHHTTGLPFLNYLPRSLALKTARKFSARIARDDSWEALLRRGIRGGTEREVFRTLRQDKTSAVLLEPCNAGLRDRIDLWYSALNLGRMGLLKQALKMTMKTIKLVSGLTLVPNLSLVIRKLPNKQQTLET